MIAGRYGEVIIYFKKYLENPNSSDKAGIFTNGP